MPPDAQTAPAIGSAQDSGSTARNGAAKTTGKKPSQPNFLKISIAARDSTGWRRERRQIAGGSRQRSAEVERTETFQEAHQQRRAQDVLDLAAPVFGVNDDLARLVAPLGV